MSDTVFVLLYSEPYEGYYPPLGLFRTLAAAERVLAEQVELHQKYNAEGDEPRAYDYNYEVRAYDVRP